MPITELPQWQHQVQRAVVDSNVQPARQKPGQGTKSYFDYYFTAPTALLYLGIHKEGDSYVRN